MADDGAYGHAVEDDVRQIAAQLGVADFVYTVPQLAKGGASREVGDALLISNGRGAILQVKSRQPNSRPEDGATWLSTRGEKAYRQGQGTRRQIGEQQKDGTVVAAFPIRSESWSPKDREAACLPLDMDVSGWPTIVVVDHPNMDGTQPKKTDAFWITTDDWLELNRALRSVTAILLYVERSLEAGPGVWPALGHEAERFRQMVQADEAFASAGGQRSRPWLSTDSLDDPTGADLYGELLLRIWPEDQAQPSQVPIEDMRRVLEFLDGVPPSMQVKVGRWILKKRSEITEHPWASGAVMFNNNELFVFGCSPASAFEEIGRFDGQLGSLACVRAEEVRQQGGEITAVLAVGHLVGDGYVDYRYIYMEPPPDVPAEMVRLIRHEYGMFDLAAGSVSFPKAERNERCPCGSGLKFKHCSEGVGSS